MCWCAISVIDTNGAPAHGAPLLYSSAAPHVWCAVSVHIIYSPFPSSAVILEGIEDNEDKMQIDAT